MKARLSGKERLFAHEYVRDHNATRAAKAAGFKVGPGLAVTASRLLRKAKVRELVSELEGTYLARVGSKAEAVLAELHYLGLARLERILNADGSVKPQGEWPEAERAAVTKVRVKEILGAPVVEADTGELKIPVVGRIVTVEMASKLGALQTLMEHHGLVRPKPPDGISMSLEELVLLARKTLELERRAAEAVARPSR